MKEKSQNFSSIEKEESLQNKPKNLPIMITIFNQKGGVGKTTATYYFGFTLSKIGFRVLLVDADPQGSLSAHIHPSYSEDPVAADEFDNELTQQKKEKKLSRIDDIFEDSIGRPDQEEKETSPDISEKVIPRQVHNYPNLFYIPGSIKFSKLDKLVTLGINRVPGLGGFAKMVPNVLRAIGKQHEIDIILIDLNPGIGGLNESIIMCSDYVLMPFKPSIGCLDAVNNLINVIPAWFHEFRAPRPQKPPFLGEKEGPLLLGTFPQFIRFRVSKKTKKPLPEISYQTWIDKIYARSETLLDVYKKQMGDQQPDILFDKFKNFIGVRDMISAGLQAQRSGHPLCDIEYKHKRVNREGKEQYFSPRQNQTKQAISNSYKKIIGVFFKLLRKEHLNALCRRVSDFQDILNLFSILSVQDLNAGLSQENAANSSPKKKKNLHWYTDREINTLLQHYLNGKENVYYALCTAPMQGDGRFAEEGQLEENIRLFLLRNIASEKRTGPETISIYIPINVGALPHGSKKGGFHWTLAIIKYNRVQENTCGIFYFDPLGKNPEVPINISTALINTVNEVFQSRIYEVNPIGPAVQRDGYNCGPWIVEMARLHAEGGDLAHLGDIDINQARKNHKKFEKTPNRRKRPNKRKKTSDTSSELNLQQHLSPSFFLDNQPRHQNDNSHNQSSKQKKTSDMSSELNSQRSLSPSSFLLDDNQPRHQNDNSHNQSSKQKLFKYSTL
jgi:cellulose biosynthesis protein BcsQ